METYRHTLNLDGIVGLTHHYGGLGVGNVASQLNGGTTSNPRAAALQGLQKAALIHSLGGLQAFAPPQLRPRIDVLYHLGFRGSVARMLSQCAKRSPWLLLAINSSSAMWTANAATVSPSNATSDGRVHITPANLVTNFHRSLETDFTARLMRHLFPGSSFFHHKPLPRQAEFADEGAANHSLLANSSARPISVFFYGRNHTEPESTSAFTARQSLAASQAIARSHGLRIADTIFTQQHPDAIAAGAFHNDVVASAEEQLFLCHEKAFFRQSEVENRIQQMSFTTGATQIQWIEVPEKRLELRRCIKTYLFNHQIITKMDGSYALIFPAECESDNDTIDLITEWRESQNNSISETIFLNLSQSMRNGGGPACLRLRLPLTEAELRQVHHPVFFTEELRNRLAHWIARHYRDRIRTKDLVDPLLYEENCYALDELSQILDLGSIYEFQRE